ncbi:flagellar hook-associated protein FlgL [Ferrimonas marina]|uniref:Flagellar hook-associated protein 3 FlgL n=1 Tax=Ferrimonas marina TaxID=299255 RepID=A0A1M5YAR5_9GAMM|nr:flagellar hook-associated protein FlgL [Ferrimonas marina]SHI09137.1 flagellar hook-associated protein 3 FlgL [Ferrimonas marina]
MRVSTNQFYNLNTQNITGLQSNTNKILQEISSGKRVNTAKDDPVGAIMIENLRQQNVQLNQYKSNITLANNRLTQLESRLGEYENQLLSTRDKLLQGNDGALGASDRSALALDIREEMEAIIALANNQDEGGNYLFAGFQTDTVPFVKDANGDVVYMGDDGRRRATIADGVSVPVSENGQRLFMASPNASGDYRADYSNAIMSGEQFFVESAKIIDPATHVPGPFEIQFLDDGAGNVDVQVVDGGGAVLLPPQPFDASQPLQFNGMEVAMTGEPSIGDRVGLDQQSEVDIFSIMNRAAEMLEDPAGLGDPVVQAEYAQLIADITETQIHASVVRAETGNYLRSLDTFEDQHLSMELVTSSAQSTLEDLDYAKAITEFEKQSLALNTVTQTFGKVNNLTLFNYI